MYGTLIYNCYFQQTYWTTLALPIIFSHSGLIQVYKIFVQGYFVTNNDILRLNIDRGATVTLVPLGALGLVSRRALIIFAILDYSVYKTKEIQLLEL